MTQPEIRSVNELSYRLKHSSEGLVRVRPRVFFELAEWRLPRNTEIRLPIPSSDIGSVTTLEATIMATLLRLFDPKSILEFGTFLGYSTSIFLRNTQSSKILSIDLPDSANESASFDAPSDVELRTDGLKNDEYLRWKQAKLGHPYLEVHGATDRARLTLLKVDSRSLSVPDVAGQAPPDFVFIDGGHDITTVESDSTLALGALGDSGIVVWHDFESNIHDGVTTFLQGWSEAPQLLAVSGTLFAVAFLGKARELLYDMTIMRSPTV